MIPLISLFSQSLHIFRFLLGVISTFFVAQVSVVNFETKNQSFKDQGEKQGNCYDENCSLLGKEVNMVMERLRIEKRGFLNGEEGNEWGLGEICRVFEEEEVRLEEVKEAFGVFDEDKDGFIDACELQRVLLALGFKQGLELKACTNMIRGFDDNLDDKIDFLEFVNLFSS